MRTHDLMQFDEMLLLQSEKYPLVVVDVDVGGGVDEEHDEELEPFVVVLETLVGDRRLVDLKQIIDFPILKAHLSVIF